MIYSNDRHALDATSLVAVLSTVDPGLPIRLLRLHAAGRGADGPTADGGTGGRLLAELRHRCGIVAWRDDAGKEWVAFEAAVTDEAVELRLRSDVGRFELVGGDIRWT